MGRPRRKVVSKATLPSTSSNDRPNSRILTSSAQAPVDMPSSQGAEAEVPRASKRQRTTAYSRSLAETPNLNVDSDEDFVLDEEDNADVHGSSSTSKSLQHNGSAAEDDDFTVAPTRKKRSPRKSRATVSGPLKLNTVNAKVTKRASKKSRAGNSKGGSRKGKASRAKKACQGCSGELESRERYRRESTTDP